MTKFQYQCFTEIWINPFCGEISIWTEIAISKELEAVLLHAMGQVLHAQTILFLIRKRQR